MALPIGNIIKGLFSNGVTELVDEVVTSEEEGSRGWDERGRIRTIKVPGPGIVGGSISDMIEVVKRAKCELHAIDNNKRKSASQSDVLSLFARLKYKYGTMYDIARTLKENHPDFYTTEHINGIEQRLKRLAQTQEPFKS